MNIKKLFAALAGVSLFAQTVVPSAGVFGATYSEELQGAYDWAYSKGVTTMSSIDNANMYGAITRAEMAKMLSVYAMEVLGMTPDTSKACSFTDIESVKGDLHDFIIKSCQLGLMGQGITAFRPYDTISRAEFGTALSRTLWGDKYEGGTPYYVKHLNALKAAGIMNQISNAEGMKEVRGYVMLMLQRSEGGSTPAEEADCDDPAIALACSLESEACPAACREDSAKDEDEKVKSGDLAVTATANNGKAILANGTSDMDTLTFKTSEEVEITKVVLERYGYSTSDDIDSVWLEDENGTIISTVSGKPDSKGQIKLSIKKDYRKVDGVLNATVVIKTDATNSVKGNKTIGFKVIDVDSTAKNVNLDKYSPYTYTVVTYSGSDVTLTTRAATKTYNWEEGKSYEVAKFKLKAPSDTSVVVKSFVLNDKNGNAIEYDDFLKNVTVTVAGKEVKSSWSVNKDDELTINLKDVELAAKENADFVVSIELADDFNKMGRTVEFYIAKATDLSATDTKTDSRVTIKTLGQNNYQGDQADWYKCTFNGGKVKVSSTKLGNVEATQDNTDIVIAEGEISTSQTIKSDANGVVVNVSNTANNNKNIVKAMRLEIGGDEYEGTATTDAKGVNTSFSFAAIDIDHASKIKILVDTDENAVDGAYATFSIEGLKAYAAGGLGFYYEDAKGDTKVSRGADMAGSLNISRLTIAPSKAALTNTIGSDEVEFKGGENSTEVTILKGTYTSKKRDTYLNEFSLEGAASQWLKDANNKAIHKMTVYLYLGNDNSSVADAELVYSGTLDKWIAKETFTNVLVKKGESIDVELKAQVEAAKTEDNNGNPINLISSKKFTLYLQGEDDQGNSPAGTADKQTSKISVVNKGTAEVETSTANKTVLLRGSDGAIAQFIVKPSGANSFDLESVSFARPSNTFDCTTLKLEGAVDEEFRLDSANNDVCIADGFVEPIEKSGETVKIVFDDDPVESSSLIAVNVDNLQINGKDVNEKFSKAYADGIVSFSQSGDGKAKTTYKVESLKTYNGSTKVRDIHFYDKNGTELLTDLGSDEVLTAGKEFTIQNSCSGEVQIMSMTYTVTRGSDYTATVTIDHATYPDYFKTTGGDKLTVYANSKDHCDANAKASVTVIAPTSLPAGVTWLGVTDLDKVQQNIVVDNTNKKITGTLKKLPAGAMNAGTDVSNGNAYVIYLKFNEAVANQTKVWVDDAAYASNQALDSDKDSTLTIKSVTDTIKISIKGDKSDTVEYDLSGLTLEA